MRYSFLLLISLIISACSVFDSEPEKPPLAGERISVLDLQRDLAPVPADATINIDLPLPFKNRFWPQAGYSGQHMFGNLEAGDLTNLELIWRSDIGKGGDDRLPLTTTPITAEGKVFTIDSRSYVRAFHDQTGKEIWETNTRPDYEDEAVIAGGLAYDNGKVFVTSGYNEVLALNAQDGKIIWRQTVSAGSRAAPTLMNNRLFIKLLDNTLIAMDTETGNTLWDYEGVGETTGLLGTASPAADEKIVVAAFSSGDLVALRVENGSIVWSDRLINLFQVRNTSTLADIRGLPVIDDNNVYAISYGGKMVAVDKATGLRRWTKEISSAETPLVVGNMIYVLDAEQTLIALEKSTGKIFWMKPLPRYENEEKRKNPIKWAGPIMANGSLMLISNDGHFSIHEAKDGSLLGRLDTGKRINSSPVISHGTFYFVSQDGSLLAYR